MHEIPEISYDERLTWAREMVKSAEEDFIAAQTRMFEARREFLDAVEAERIAKEDMLERRRDLRRMELS